MQTIFSHLFYVPEFFFMFMCLYERNINSTYLNFKSDHAMVIFNNIYQLHCNPSVITYILERTD